MGISLSRLSRCLIRYEARFTTHGNSGDRGCGGGGGISLFGQNWRSVKSAPSPLLLTQIGAPRCDILKKLALRRAFPVLEALCSCPIVPSLWISPNVRPDQLRPLLESTEASVRYGATARRGEIRGAFCIGAFDIIPPLGVSRARNHRRSMGGIFGACTLRAAN